MTGVTTGQQSSQTDPENSPDDELVVTRGTETGTVSAESSGGSENGQTSGLQAGGQAPEGYIYVCGAVEEPGVYPIQEGMRVFEAIELAGGFAQEADQLWLNQAEIVTDGQRLYVYTKDETQLLAEAQQESGMPAWQHDSQMAEGSDAQEQKVNLNTADREVLMTLPGIGEVKADAIIQYREAHGAFSSIEEIQNITGIKNAVFSKIKDRITV